MGEDRSRNRLEADAWRAGNCPVCGNAFSIDATARERYCEFEETLHPDHSVRGPLPKDSPKERPN